ncbi:MAG: AAA family ATPase [Cytophagaceae bacterium]|jgi:predicted  nucleic acid-binding Zn-ribbon protein|nr:AAA family ATPase [Cytophagaceae bacterium]
MNNIIIKQITLLNFKGQRNLTIDFNEKDTSISGANATGKTTIFDAFTWLLFGKDSEDRTEQKFNLKTLDETGKPFERIPHEVSAILLVDGVETVLKKIYEEKWIKTRGSVDEEFKGHTTTHFVNDIPCSEKEYMAKVDAICSYQVFKLITNPLFFPSQTKDFQRKALFDLAGNVADDEIAANKEEFKALLAALTGKTIEEYKREISAKKSKIKKEIAEIPGRIDEHKRCMPESHDWADIESQISAKKQEVDAIDDQISDYSKSVEAENKKRADLQSQLGKLKEVKTQHEFEIKERVLKDYHTKETERNALFVELERLQNELSSNHRQISTLTEKKISLNNQLAEFRSGWAAINAETLIFGDHQFDCPTCKRPLEIEDIEAKQSELTANFNKNKADKLEKNKQSGLTIKKDLGTTETIIGQKDAYSVELESKISKIQQSDLYLNAPYKPDARPYIERDGRWIECCLLIGNLERQITESNAPTTDNSDLKSKKQTLNNEIDLLKQRLSLREAIQTSLNRIAELEKEYKAQSQELASLEGVEFTIAAFGKAKVEAIESRINGLFSLVNFKMYEQQINGGELETCEAMVNGVPFTDLNNAMKINAGLDIINAFCKKQGIYAPIFIDNRESVNNIIPCESQIINLIVSTDKQLVIK